MNAALMLRRPAVRPWPALLLCVTLLTACRTGTATPTTVSGGAASTSARPPVATITPVPFNTPRPATPIVTRTEVQVLQPFTDIGLATGYTRNESIIGGCSGPSLASSARPTAPATTPP